MNGLNILDWLPKLGSIVVRWVSRPKLELTPNIDKEGASPYYLRLEVKNTGKTTAKKCVGRLIEVKKESGEVVNLRQLNLCWAGHNQANLPHPEDIHKAPFSIYLDIAKCETNSEYIKFRVETDNQQLSVGPYNSEFRELKFDAVTYYVRVSVYTEDGLTTTRWYILEKSGSRYDIKERKPPKKRK